MVIQKISKELEEDLILVFNALGCKHISLFGNESEGKVLNIYLGRNRSRGGYQYLYYSEKKNDDLGEEILPDWYFKLI